MIQNDLCISSIRNVNFYRFCISKYVQLISKVVCSLVTDVTRSSCTVIFKRMRTVIDQCVDVYPFSNEYVLIYKILASVALKYKLVLDKLYPDTVKINVYCVL